MIVQEEIKKYLQHQDKVNVVIAGSTCSGKTTLANEIRKTFMGKEAVTIVSQDDYFKDISDIPRGKAGYLMDSIEAFHQGEFKQDVEKLLQDGVAWMPRYHIATNTRIGKNKLVRSSRINVIEGLHTITLLRNIPHAICIFVDTDIEICLNRRILRDTTQYNVPEAIIRRYWNNCMLPMYQRDILPQRRTADLIIENGGR